jgi:superfamily II DNA or RNA helicase
VETLPFTRKRLVAWAGEQAVRDAEQILARDMVIDSDYRPPVVEGSLRMQSREMKTGFRILPDGNVENFCPCYTNKERGLICSHIMAVALHLLKRAADPMRDAHVAEEKLKARNGTRAREEEYVRRVGRDTPGAVPATLEATLPSDWKEACGRGVVPVRFHIEFRGRRLAIPDVARNIPLSFDKDDESLLFVIEDIAGGPCPESLSLSRFDMVNLLRLKAGKGVAIHGADNAAVNRVKVSTHLRIDLDGETGELILSAHTELPFQQSGRFPFYVISGRAGWAYGADNFWPLETVFPAPYHQIYEDPVVIPRPDVLRFFAMELPALSDGVAVESDLSPDLFTVDPATPSFHLEIRGSPASLSATLWAVYGDIRLVACRPHPKEHFAVPDPEDLMRYTVRNPHAEARAVESLAPFGFRGTAGDDLTSIVGNREVLNFLAGGQPALRRRGWRLTIEGKVAPYMEEMHFATPVVHIRQGGEGRWFDVTFDFDAPEDASISAADVQRALLSGDSFVRSGSRTLLLDSKAIESMRDVFSDCISEEADTAGTFRLSGIYAPFVKSSLDSLDGVDVEDTPEWRKCATDGNRLSEPPPLDLDPAIAKVLRPYQTDGVRWLRFLEANAFCGILADEMGLGKTIQTLVWLNMPRLVDSAAGAPALIVCPTSIVENWAEEAGRFVPNLRVSVVSGPDREAKWKEAMTADIVITSYALLRRDVEQCRQYEFSVLVLDEAQHIKNHSTQNAVSAKQIRATHRLVLTGTPIENSVLDLWSIMDFLMPNYLGTHSRFRELYERPIGRGDQEGEVAQLKLRRKLHPFLLRRLKKDVARDLPPKIERVTSCSLTPDQQVVYAGLLDAGRRAISNMVAQRGFQRCRMEILATLLRLRQACCHLDLLGLEGVAPRFPSAKMDLFFELMDEALDGGHRVLVFSQFVRMLRILEKELTSRSIEYCYLDGSTKDRMSIVHKFNTTRSIPVFLISLKAGGTGLNLTGADMVVHFDPWWNPAVEDQATDRAYRIGQKRTVYSVKLVTKGTVEEKVVALQERKKGIINATLQDQDSMPAHFDWDDIRDILSL